MKKTINGRAYDTDTAQLLVFNSYAVAADPVHWEEGLYRKQSGEFFLYGEGGPGSRYHEKSGDAWTEGSKIVPLTDDQVRAWVKEHADGLYEELFGATERIVAEGWAEVRAMGPYTLGFYLTAPLREAGIGPGDRVRVRVEKVRCPGLLTTCRRA